MVPLVLDCGDGEETDEREEKEMKRGGEPKVGGQGEKEENNIKCSRVQRRLLLK